VHGPKLPEQASSFTNFFAQLHRTICPAARKTPPIGSFPFSARFNTIAAHYAGTTDMNSKQHIFIGTDSGATTTKFSAVYENGEAVSTKVLQRPTNSQNGRDAVIAAWIGGVGEFLAQNKLEWSQVAGVGLAIPGPYERYGVWGKSPNLPASFSGWNVYEDYKNALAKAVGRPVPLCVGNDGNYGGVAEAKLARGKSSATVAMLMPGSGLGAAFVGADGLCLDGDTLAGMEAGLGLRRGLHDHLRAFDVAGGEVAEVSRPRTAHRARHAEGKGALPPHPRAKGRRPRAGNFRLPGARHGHPRRQSCHGARPRHLHHRRRPDGPRVNHA
jgi:hypothetical protein